MSTRTPSARDRLAMRRDLVRLVRDAIAKGDMPADSEDDAVERLGDYVRRLGITRRTLLKASAASAGVSIVAIDFLSRTAEAMTLASTPPTLTVNALRRDDMLALRFDLYNLVRDKQNLVRQAATQPAYIVAQLGYGNDAAPQNIAEQAFLETAPALNNGSPATAGETLADPGKVQARLAGATRLAFRVPDAMTSIPFTLASLLDFAQFQMNVVPSALPPLADGTVPSPLPTLRAPFENETAIETPWDLILSPHKDSTFAHAATPVVRNGRTELWHARLAVRQPTAADPTKFMANELDASKRTLRAVWTNPFDIATVPPEGDEGPFRMSLKPTDRYQIVRLTSDFSLTTKTGDRYWEPKTIDVEKLMLSALGAWQSTRYAHLPPHDFNLAEWKHIATMARDQYVKVVYVGWLIPFGHPAALIKVTERKIQPVPASPDRGAYLRQRFFIVVRQPVLTYPDAAPQPDHGRKMPYKTVEIKTTVTPTLDDPEAAAWTFESQGDLAFIPVVSTKPFEFAIKGTDRDGQTSEFTMPLVFVSFPFATLTDAMIAKVVADYEATTGCPSFTAAMKTATLNGQKIGIAPSTKSEGAAGGKPGDTAVEVKNLTWGTAAPTVTVPFGQAPFYPVWDEAEVRLNGVEQVQGGTLAKTVIQPHPTYVSSGFDSSEVFAQLKDNINLSFTDPSAPAVDRAGGMVNPDMSIGGLSRKLGPVGGDVKAAIPSQFDPATFFKGAKILGGIKLEDIIEAVAFGSDAIPKLQTNTVYPSGDTSQPPEKIVTTFHFEPDLKADPAGIFDPTGATMTLDATFTAPIVPPGEPTYEIVGDMRDFAVTLLGTISPFDTPLLTLSFNQLKFTTKNGSKPNVDVDINEVTFDGPLAFVNTLKDFLKLGSTGPSIDIQPTSVTAGFSIPIPTIGVGVLTIQNIAFGAALTIPFTGEPARVRFNFSEREDPFLVTVIGLGGGGFFAIALGLDGLEVFEASIEVGASIAIDLGIASGEVHALAGIYYKLERVEATTTPAPGVAEHDKTTLEGYVRLGGSVNVLGIASVSVEFYLGLKYENPPNELWGQATLTVEVEVLCFSKSFELSIEKRIPGPGLSSALPALGIAATASNGGHLASLAPKHGSTGFDFTDLMTKTDWDEYAAAFATS